MNATQPYIPEEIPELPSTEDLEGLSNAELLLRMTIAVDRHDMMGEFEWKLPENVGEARKKIRVLRDEVTKVIRLLADHLTV